MASRKFKGISGNMLETMFEFQFNHIYKGLHVTPEAKASLRQMFFIGCDIVHDHFSYLATNHYVIELADTMDVWDKELGRFKNQQLAIIEKEAKLNG